MKHLVRTSALALATFAAACGITDVENLDEVVDLFVQSLDVEAFEASIVSGPSQVEVALLPGGLTARELAVRPSGASEEERVQSKAVSVSGDAQGGSITLLLGELEVSFDEDTRFWFGNDEIDADGFLAEVRADIAAGHEPPIVAERLAPATPQEPEDGSFLADAIAVTGDGAANLRVEVDADNLELVSDPQEGDPDGWLTILGLRIQLRVSDGTTEIESHDHDFDHIEDFEGHVSSVSVSDGIVTLADGTVIQIVDRTHIKNRDELITTLAGVSEALAAGDDVVAWGTGAVETEEPLVLIGLEVAFKRQADEEPLVEEFEGDVSTASPSDGKLTLVDGTLVRIVDGTEVVAHDDHSPHDVEGVADALERGRIVRAWGHGTVESEDPLVIEADHVVLKAVIEDFEEDVVEIDVATGLIELANGWHLTVTDDTEIAAADDASPMTLEGAAQALEDGDGVRVWGWGFVTGEDPVSLELAELTIRRVVGG